jgi:hypothetical protein
MRPPWADSDSPWDRISFGTLAFGGLVEVDGDALKRKVTRHRASGSNGARITDRGLDTVEVTIKLIAWTEEHATQLDAIRDLLIPRTRPTRGRSAVAVTHPALAWAGITQIYATEVSLPKVDGSRLTVTIKATEYKEPAAGAASSTRRARPATQDAQVCPGVQALYSANPIPAPSASGAASPPANFSR